MTSALQGELEAALRAAMKAGDVTARETLRMALAALKNRRIELGQDLDDAAVQAVLAKEVKKRQDSAEQYAQAGRPDRADAERAEMAVLQRYLPGQLDEDETRTVVQAAIEREGLGSKQDLGRLMKAVMATHKGQVDGKLVQRIAGELLS